MPGVNGWTGGQYSVYRALFGLYLFAHFAGLLGWGAELFSSAGMLPDAASSPLYPLFPNLLFVFDTPVVVSAFLALGLAASVAFSVGWHDRTAAFALWLVWASLFTRNPLIANPSLPFVGWLLLAHLAVPAAPYGSVRALGRADPGGGWRLPPALFAAAWIVMALAYSYSGYTKLLSPSWLDGTALARVLENPLARPTGVRELLLALPAPLLAAGTWGALGLELCFAPLALVRRLRPWLWLALLGMHLGLVTLIDFADLSLGMVVLHGFTFDPAWIRPVREDAQERPRAYYDGSCALCHGAVRFLLAEDRAGRFAFAPLESASFAAAVPAAERERLPDSMALLDEDGRLHLRSAAVLGCAERLGGLWRAGALALRLVPVRALDVVYDAIAAQRKRIFGTKAEACPLLPPELRARIEL